MAEGADVAVVVLSPVSGRARRVAEPTPTLEVWIEASFALEAERAMRPVPHPGFRPGSTATHEQAPSGFVIAARPVGTEMALLGVDGHPMADLAGHDHLDLGVAPASGGVSVAGVRSSWPELIGAARVYSATAPPRPVPMAPVAVEADATSKLVRILWFGRVAAAGLSSVTVGVALEEAGRPYPWPPTLASAQGSGVASLEGTLVMSGGPIPAPEPDIPLDGTMAVRGKAPASQAAPFALAPAGSNPGRAASTPGAPWSSASPVAPIPASQSFDGTVALASSAADEVAAAQAKLAAMEAEEEKKQAQAALEAERFAEAEAEKERLAHEAEQKAKREAREAARKTFEAEQAEARRREAERASKEAQAEKDRAKRLMNSVYGGFKK